MVKRLIGEDVELSVALDPILWAIKVDPDQITQVLLNLCANARDAMPEGGKLTLETRNVVVDAEMASRHPSFLPGCYCSLAVTDTGHGMTKEVQERIFEPFFTTKERGKGTGLGLSTVYGIVKQSGGYVWVYSEPGHGSCFRLYFPRVDQPLTAVAPVTSALEHRGETILVVEDEDALRQAVCHHLTRLGYVVLQAASGQQALEVVNRHPGVLDLLLTDVIMPKMSGPELARQLKRRQPIVVLYMSGYADEAIVHRGALDPGVTLIHKPFSMDTLAVKLRDLLDGQGKTGGAATK
jgi:CheY-like chemotaxis protein